MTLSTWCITIVEKQVASDCFRSFAHICSRIGHFHSVVIGVYYVEGMAKRLEYCHDELILLSQQSLGSFLLGNVSTININITPLYDRCKVQREDTFITTNFGFTNFAGVDGFSHE